MNSPLAGILNCARRAKHLTEAHAAGRIGITPAEYVKMESGTLEPTVFQWSQLTELFDIPKDALKYGFLDRQTVAEIRSGRVENGFHLPQRYSDYKCLKVRALLPVLQYIGDKKGGVFLSRTLHELDMEENFFMSLDNQIGLRFLEDLLCIVFPEEDLDYPVLEVICAYSASVRSHGTLSLAYKDAGSGIELIRQFVRHSSRYQALFSCELAADSDRKLEIKIVPKVDIGCLSDQYLVKTLVFLEEFRIEQFRKIPALVGDTQPLFVEERQSIYHGAPFTLYEVRCA